MINIGIVGILVLFYLFMTVMLDSAAYRGLYYCFTGLLFGLFSNHMWNYLHGNSLPSIFLPLFWIIPMIIYLVHYLLHAPRKEKEGEE